MRTDTIDTERLTLRPLRRSDSMELYDIMKDEATARITGFRPMTSPDEADALIRRWDTLWYMKGWAVVEKESGRLAGVLQEALIGIGEKGAGYWLAEWARGRGYMTEALSAFRDSVFSRDEYVDTIRLFAFPRNEASSRVARKCGFFYDGTTFGSYLSEMGEREDEDHWSISRGDWIWRQRQCA